MGNWRLGLFEGIAWNKFTWLGVSNPWGYPQSSSISNDGIFPNKNHPSIFGYPRGHGTPQSYSKSNSNPPWSPAIRRSFSETSWGVLQSSIWIGSSIIHPAIKGYPHLWVIYGHLYLRLANYQWLGNPGFAYIYIHIYIYIYIIHIINTRIRWLKIILSPKDHINLGHSGSPLENSRCWTLGITSSGLTDLPRLMPGSKIYRWLYFATLMYIINYY